MVKRTKTILSLVVVMGFFCSTRVETRSTTITSSPKTNNGTESHYFTKLATSEDTATKEPGSIAGTEATIILIPDMPKRMLKNVASQATESTVPPTILVPHDSFYAMGDDNVICAAAKFDAQVIMTLGIEEGVSFNSSIPVFKNSTFNGSCSGENPVLIISWYKDIQLALTFNRTEDTWSLAKMDLRSSDADSRETHQASGKDLESFKAPIGQSLVCQIPHEIVFENLHKGPNYFIAYLNINNVRMQAYNVPPQYSSVKLCPPHHIRYHSDEAVFVTAGILGASAVVVVIGYGIYRGLKSKKVDYGAM